MLQTFRDLMRLSHGFESAKIFLTANDLDLFRKVEGGATPSSLAINLSFDERALTLLMNALTALGLLEKDGDVYSNSPVVSEYLGGGGYRGHIFRHIHHCWGAWNNLHEVVRTGGSASPRERSVLGDDDERTRDFIRGMDDVTRELAPLVVGQLDLRGAKVLLDVGGGPGTYAAAFLEAHPSLKEVRLFDLPVALDVARGNLAGKGLAESVRLVEGNYYDDAFDGGVDVVWISQVFHSLDEDGCRMLIEKAWNALNPGGQLFVHEFLLDEGKTSPLTAALFAVHMLVMTEGGRTYTGGEIGGWMSFRGFEDIVIRKVSDDTGVVFGRKP